MVSCGLDPLGDSSDYRIVISNAHGTIDRGGGTFEYGFTIENQGIVAATQLEIIVRFSFNDGFQTGSQDNLATYTMILDVGESDTLDFIFTDGELSGSFSIDDLVGARVIAVRFFNIEESSSVLFENTYQGIEGQIPIN